MKPISATAAIAPAFRRTRSVLGEPFRLGFFLKLVIVAAFAGANVIAMGILLPMQAANLLFQFIFARQGSSPITAIPLPHLPGIGAAFFALMAFGVFIYLLFCGIFFYVFTRFRFMVFEAVLNGEKKLGRAWTKYGRAAWRYYGLSILMALACMLVATAVASPVFLVCLRMLHAGASDSPRGTIYGFFAVFLLIEYALIFLSVVIDGLARDFLLPSMALENAGIEASFARFSTLVREDVAGVFVFTLLRFLFRLALGITFTILMAVPMVIVGLILGGVAALSYHPLWRAGLAGQAVFVGYVTIAGLAFIGLYFILICTVTGVISVFTQCYALIFFADRYLLLGNILNPPAPALVEIPLEDIPPSLPENTPENPPPFLPEPPPVW